MLHIKAMHDNTSKSLEQYALAGGLASESIASIRTINALNAQPDIVTQYRKFLLEAMRIGITKGLRFGIFTGGMWFIVLCTYERTLSLSGTGASKWPTQLSMATRTTLTNRLEGKFTPPSSRPSSEPLVSLRSFRL
jgi:hypothetical protein